MTERSWRFGWIAGLTLIVAIVIEPIAASWTVLGARAETLLVAAVCLALRSNRIVGAAIGFLSGLITGAVLNRSLGEYCVSHTVAGFAAGWVPEWIVRDRLLTAVGVVFGGTVLAHLTFLLVHPGDLRMLAWVQDTMAKAAYNGVVAIPMYALLRRLVPSTNI